jgi:2-isopropylmalate synthase
VTNATTKCAAKYRGFPAIERPDRRWPGRSIARAPRWCSVDLRDGNQALVEPMDVARKRRMFDELLRIGFKEIEVGFPAASQPDFDFVRALIEEDLVPEDVTLQVLTQARNDQIERSVASLRGARRAVVHLYNSTSTLQRRVVFGLDRAGIRDIAVRGARRIAELRNSIPETEIALEYSPESFTGTELDFALEISEAVMDVWQPTASEPIILNLPATVEMATPNVYADQIEWFGDQIRDRDCVVLSVHPHNDRGTAVAAAELAVMAGADRVEGTLFGNGERTGNVDLINLALNLFSQGVDPGLELRDIDRTREIAEFCNRLPVHARHPYAGELVYTSFSGSHQDAIKKGLAARAAAGDECWEVPYLPIDPADVGRSYEAVVRVNSQSGKGGVAFLLERDRGLRLPRNLQIEFSREVQRISEACGGEITSRAIWQRFAAEYLERRGPIELLSYGACEAPADPQRFDHRARSIGRDQRRGFEDGGQGAAFERPGMEDGGQSEEDGRQFLEFRILFEGNEKCIRGAGNGPIDAFVDALERGIGQRVRILDFSEHAVREGADAGAVAYVEVDADRGRTLFGVGRHANSTTACLAAVAAAANRLRTAGTVLVI